MMNKKQLRTMVQALLAHDLPTQARIREIIAEVRPVCPDVTDAEAEELAIEFEEIHGVRMSDGAALQNPGFEPWLDAARSGIEFYYWRRYRLFMAEKGLSGQVLGGLGNITDRVLGLLENPNKTGKWDRRGMVMGHVQSGKTANYIGVVSKAADAGYRVIIIIAGVQNNLRNQTQRRVDEGFIGFSSMPAEGNTQQKRNVTGVGRYNLQRQPAAFTTSYMDFHKKIAQSVNLRLQNLKEPAVFVIKKNPSTLNNLIDWLKVHNATLGTETIGDPMLLIDDEADNASINIKRRKDKVSRINGQIRELLNLFDRSCYIGYTATPFANIFIDPDTDDQMVGHDLFPRDFIVSLDAPTNYFGPSRVFHDNAAVVLRNLEDYADSLPRAHKIDHRVTELPESLREAIRVFIVARAIRLVRGQTHEHNSMIVNVSIFMNVQRQIRDEIHSFVDHIRSSVRVNGAKQVDQAARDPEMAGLRSVFERHYGATCEENWVAVQTQLHESVSAISIVEVNSKAKPLDYAEYEEKGLNVIAVGGLSLSRGLTLEGLTVSYFLRRSMMYDTLFQMGRWFGYRDGYEDLCRVWMPEEAQGWYEHIAESIDELRDELVQMQSANATPIDFGLKVRSHPDTLMVTANNKIGTGQNHAVFISLAKKFVETGILRRDQAALQNNLRAVERLAEEMRRGDQAPENGEELNGGRLVRDVPVTAVNLFLGLFKNHSRSLKTESEPVRRYIDPRSGNELSKWDVLFAGVSSRTANSLVDTRLGFPLVCQRRKLEEPKPGKRIDNSMLMINRQRASSRGVARAGVTKEDAQMEEEKYDAQNPQSEKTRNYPDWIYGKIRRKPLLVIHLLAIGKEEEDLSDTSPVAAWSISFPKTNLTETKVGYIVNTTWCRENFGDDYYEDESDEDEE